MEEVSFRTAEAAAPGTLTASLHQEPTAANPDINLVNPISPESAAATAKALGPYPWILSPSIDILFCCGGAFWLLYLGLALTNYGMSYNGNTAAMAFFGISVLGLHIFGDGHQPATLFRVYGSKVTRDSIGKPVAVIILISLMAGLSALFVPVTTDFLIKFVLAWGFQHQLAQSYGITLVYCYKRKYYLNAVEKKIMLAMVHTTMVYLILRMFAIKDFGTFKLMNFYDVPFAALVPEWVCNVALVAMLASVAVFIGMVGRKYVKEKRMMPLPALLVIMTLTALPIISGNHFALLYYSFSQWFFHSSQYLVVTSAFYFKEKGLPPGVSFHQISRMLFSGTSFLYFGLILIVGFLVAFQLPVCMTNAGIAEKALCFISIWIFLNIQHFWTDAFIWKLRDPVIQKLLIS
ncbi:MAG TPA: hypothetical protein PKZ32_02380 [Candidatus Melainabacteria bacterium]|nr:hypothetical protein [Candidatus Melainabacteria bacterium]